MFFRSSPFWCPLTWPLFGFFSLLIGLLQLIDLLCLSDRKVARVKSVYAILQVFWRDSQTPSHNRLTGFHIRPIASPACQGRMLSLYCFLHHHCLHWLKLFINFLVDLALNNHFSFSFKISRIYLACVGDDLLLAEFNTKMGHKFWSVDISSWKTSGVSNDLEQPLVEYRKKRLVGYIQILICFSLHRVHCILIIGFTQ